MATRYRVIKVKGAAPEVFIIVGIEFDDHAIQSVSLAMSEPDLRAHLRETGASVEEINSWIEQGREYPG
jgi:hypothetical protein